jgi:hypothetical protein
MLLTYNGFASTLESFFHPIFIVNNKANHARVVHKNRRQSSTAANNKPLEPGPLRLLLSSVDIMRSSASLQHRPQRRLAEMKKSRSYSSFPRNGPKNVSSGSKHDVAFSEQSVERLRNLATNDHIHVLFPSLGMRPRWTHSLAPFKSDASRKQLHPHH